MKTLSLTIGWLYPTLMNVYGDRGNFIAISRRSEWRGIKTQTKMLEVGFSEKDLLNCDVLLMGGAQDRQQQMVNNDLLEKKKSLEKYIFDEKPGLYVCGGYQFLGKYYKEASGKVIKGLGIFDLYTEHPGEKLPRLIGNMAFKIKLSDTYYTIVGFENHGGRTYLGKNIEPFGEVLKGNGNNGTDKTEGAKYKNSFGTYSHGPLLPKNPDFTDYLISVALEKKYGSKVKLKDLNNALEQRARFSIANRIGVRI